MSLASDLTTPNPQPTTVAPPQTPASKQKPKRRLHFTKRVWQLHSWLGLICGLGLLVIGVTGSLLVFHDEVDAWRFPALFRSQPTPAGRLSYDALWTTMRQTVPPKTIVGWLFTRSDGTDEVYVTHVNEDDPRTLHLDPYTGNVRGRPYNMQWSLSGWLLKLHYNLRAGRVGLLIAGLLACMLLLLGASGLWLYRGFWRNILTLRWGKSARIFFSDLHKMVGISSTAFNLILGFTGAWWNLSASWTLWNPAPAPAPPPAHEVAVLEFGAGGLSLDALTSHAGRELPGFQPTYMSMPTEREGEITLYGTVPSSNPLRGDYGSRVIFNAADGALKQVVDIRQAGVLGRVEDAFVLLHYGTFGAAFGPVVGMIIKILWTLFGLAPGVLAVSGFLIWRTRRRRVTRSREFS